MFAGKKSAQIREILINESAWEDMTCLFAPSLRENLREEVGDNVLADKMAAIIESSAGAGKDQAGGYLAPVSRYLSVAKGGR
ncbi:hypothetical protein JNO21_24730 [Escherichia coli]|uniref:hypothetical protein n=1 Tax=Escherichia coli TaxID=562 RepID=UPI00192E1E36|nr:hypothetical protein [Escherichia coli]MBL6509549.1 hypothetical protein [Escherichia coli]